MVWTQEYSVVRILWLSGWGGFWKELLLVTVISTTWGRVEVIFRVKWIMFVSQWCCKSGPLGRELLASFAMMVFMPFTGNWALKLHNRMNSKQGKLKEGGGGIIVKFNFGLQVDEPIPRGKEAYDRGQSSDSSLYQGHVYTERPQVNIHPVMSWTSWANDKFNSKFTDWKRPHPVQYLACENSHPSSIMPPSGILWNATRTVSEDWLFSQVIQSLAEIRLTISIPIGWLINKLINHSIQCEGYPSQRPANIMQVSFSSIVIVNLTCDTANRLRVFSTQHINGWKTWKKKKSSTYKFQFGVQQYSGNIWTLIEREISASENGIKNYYKEEFHNKN